VKIAKDVWSIDEGDLSYEDEAMRAHAKKMIFPIGEPNDKFAQYFTGKSFLAPVSTSQVGIFNVTFEPGCRNNWHIHHAKSGGGQILICIAGRRYLPYAFTEQGIYMLATVLRGKLAEQQSIFIMRTFREMRHYIRQNQQFVTRNEMDLLTAKAEKFIRIGEYRMNKAVDAIGRLENLANRGSYEYTQEQVDAMFQRLSLK